MRKCLDCNTELKDFEMKCSECGSENLSVIEEEQPHFKEKKPKAFIILLCAVVVLGLVCAIIVGNNAKKAVPAKPIETAIVALYSGDIQGYVDEIYGDFKVEAENFFLDTYGNFDAYKQETEDILKDAYGNKYEMTSKVVDVFSYSDLMIEFYQEACDELGFDIQIEDMKHVTVRVSIENDEGAQEYYMADEFSVQVGGKWYFLPKDMLSFDEEE